MFEDFSPKQNRQARKRLGGSMVIAASLYAGLSAALIGASAEARQVFEEKLTQVTFAPPPPPPPPPPPAPVLAPAPPPEPVAPPPKPRPKAKRPTLVAPEEVPQEKPPESNRELPAAKAPGPVEGFLDGVEGGVGTAKARAVKTVVPPPPPAPRPAPRVVPARVEKLIVPVALQTTQPKYSASLRRKGIEGAVVVSFEVLEDGKVTNPRIVSGPPELHETVLKTVVTWRFKPARRGAIAVRHRLVHTIQFRLEGY
jgi:periplasmic protein TonB